MKYLVCFTIMALLAMPLRQARAQPSFVANTFANSRVNQFIFINCQTDECLSFIDKYFSNENFSVNSAAAVISDSIIDDPVSPPLEASANSTVGLSSAVIAPANETAASTNSTALVQTATLNSNATVESSNSTAIVQTQTASANSTAAATTTVLPVLNYAPRSVLISEIMAVPNTGDKEWVELFNSTNAAIDLADWSLYEGSSLKTNLFGAIQPSGYLAFDKSSLNNDGDIVILKDPTGAVIDQVAYGGWSDGNASDNAPNAAKGDSLILWQGAYIETITPTRAAENILTALPAPVAALSVSGTTSEQETVVQPATSAETTSVQNNQQYQYSDQVLINEFLPNPAGSDDSEWIELYNSGGVDVNLYGWSLGDNGGSAPYKIKDLLAIKAKNFLLFGREQTKIALNNTSDEVVLNDPNGQAVSRFAYDKTQENYSWARFDSGWEQTSALTPGEENEKPDLQAAAVVEIPKQNTIVNAINAVKYYSGSLTPAEIKELPLKSKVSVNGQVAVLPGVFSKNTINLVNGLQIYYSKADWPALRLGDIVQASGTTSESLGVPRVLIKNKSDLKILGNEPLPEPRTVNSNEINADLADLPAGKAGAYVRIVGDLVQKDRGKLTFADDFGEFSVNIKAGTQINAGVLALNEKIQVTGLTALIDGAYWILPREQGDLVNLTLKEKATAGKEAMTANIQNGNISAHNVGRALGILLAILGAANAYFVWRKKDEIIAFFKEKKWQTLIKKII
ncbi:MAG: lamin tail domain-containing protein [Parcubacteria group bacterium]